MRKGQSCTPKVNADVLPCYLAVCFLEGHKNLSNEVQQMKNYSQHFLFTELKQEITINRWYYEIWMHNNIKTLSG